MKFFSERAAYAALENVYATINQCANYKFSSSRSGLFSGQPRFTNAPSRK